MSKRRRTRAVLIPPEHFLCFHEGSEEVHFSDPEESYEDEIYIKNCGPLDLVPNSIVVLKPVKDGYWERVV